MQEEKSVNKCKKCGSINLDVKEMEDVVYPDSKGVYNFTIFVCRDCGISYAEI